MILDKRRKVSVGFLSGSAIMLAAIRLIGVPVSAQTEAQMEKAERIKTKKAIAKAMAARPSLKDRTWPEGNAETLQETEAKDIVKMEIFSLEWTRGIEDPRRRGLARKQRSIGSLTWEEDSAEIRGLLMLLRHANEWKPPRSGHHDKPPSLNRSLVVQRAKGEPFEIMYSSELDAPFGGLWSLELKEALYALAGGRTQITIIHFNEARVQRVIHQDAVAPQRGVVASQTVTTKMQLTPADGLTLHVRVHDRKNTLMEDQKSIHYGEAKVFASKGPGSWIVLLHQP